MAARTFPQVPATLTGKQDYDAWMARDFADIKEPLSMVTVAQVQLGLTMTNRLALLADLTQKQNKKIQAVNDLMKELNNALSTTAGQADTTATVIAVASVRSLDYPAQLAEMEAVAAKYTAQGISIPPGSIYAIDPVPQLYRFVMTRGAITNALDSLRTVSDNLGMANQMWQMSLQSGASQYDRTMTTASAALEKLKSIQASMIANMRGG